MKNLFFSLLAVVLIASCTFSQSQEKLFPDLPRNIEGVYGGITNFGFYYRDGNGHSWWESASKVRIALQTRFTSPIGEIKVRSAHEFMNNETTTNFFVHNEWKKIGVDVGFKSLPMTFLHRNFPFTAGGQFEYESQKIIGGSTPSINIAYEANDLQLFYGFGQRATTDKKFIPEQQVGIKIKIGSLTTKLAASHNNDLDQGAVTLQGFGITAMAGYGEQYSETQNFYYLDLSVSDQLGAVYGDYVRKNGHDNYLEFGQYWTTGVYKDVVIHIGYGYAPTSKFFYVYSFMHI